MSARVRKAFIIFGWLVLWQLVSWMLSNALLLAGPLEVFVVLAQNLLSVSFWQSIGFSFLRIALGGIAAFALGVFASFVAQRLPLVQEILEPAVSFLKTVPVVCVIVLMLLWVGSSWTSTIVVIMVVFPGVYYSMLEALDNIDGRLLEMLKVFKVGGAKRFLFFTWPSVLPFIVATSKVVVGMSWKSGVAAEIIGIPLGSIGEQLYLSKITLATADLFSWTIVIVLLSMACEKLVLWVLARSHTGTRFLALKMSGPPKRIPNDTEEESPAACKVSIAYEHEEGKAIVVNDFSYQFSQGSRYCIMAPSGYGKTSLLKVLLGLKMPYKGSVSGFEYTSAVFQEDRLIEDCTALENCQIVAPRDTSFSYTERVLLQLISRDKLEVAVSELSGGMRRRVELARALIASSEVIILDEPFTGLDNETRCQTAKVLLEHQAGRTIIMATHNEDDSRVLDATVVRL